MSRAHKRARPLADEVEAISAELDDPEAMMWALHLKGYILGTEGDLAGSADARHRCLDLARTVGDSWFQLICTGNLGDIALKEGRFEEALALSEEAVASAEELGYSTAVISEVANRAMALLGLGRLHAAEAGFVDVMRRSESHRQVEGRGWAAVGLAAVAIRRGAAEDAALLLGFIDAMLARTGYALEGFELAQYDETEYAVRERLDQATLKRLRVNGAALAAEDSVEPLLNALGCLREDALA